MTDAQLQFDVFLVHNSQDKPLVRVIANELKRRGIKAWLDEEQIPPGRPFQDEIQQVIPLVKSAAILIGLQGLGSWQNWELRALISLCVKKNISVIPVLLPGVSHLPEYLLFLEQFRWVSFSEEIDDENALYLLEWGITGKKPQPTVKIIPQNPSENTLQNRQDNSGDELSSEGVLYYKRLHNFLKLGEWKEADQETFAVMLKASDREEEGWLDDESIDNFPCTDLYTIDQLWVKYSNGRFGFSVQKDILQSVDQDLEKFGDLVGWRQGMFWNKGWLVYRELTFDTNAPQGHLPRPLGRARISPGLSSELVMGGWVFRLWESWGGYVSLPSLASRLRECNL
ncbi:MAG: GUN4 domain-containing protein [Iphinoe sp. HA4291-MV1]|jgi:hypothetical protein|nr:GUN4 domain-containing protein [Iphinoe sp. HA4291-MV1]